MPNSQFMVTRADTQNSYGSRTGYGPISSISSLEKCTKLHRGSNRSQSSAFFWAEQHVYWQEQGRYALNFQQTIFERVAREYEQAARHEVHGTVAQATEMSRAEMRERMGAFENQAEQTWTSHQVTLLNDMKSVASDALENQRSDLLTDATMELQRHQRHSHEHLQECQQGVRSHLSEVQEKNPNPTGCQQRSS